jgi:hypothetical protein
VKCPYCSADNIIDLADISNISSYERGMGPETLYEFDNDDVSCENCKQLFRVYGYVSEYPQGSSNNEEITIESIDASLL